MNQEHEATGLHCHSLSSCKQCKCVCVSVCVSVYVSVFVSVSVSVSMCVGMYVCMIIYINLFACVCLVVYAVLPPQALLLLGTVCVVWMGVKFGCRVNSSLVRVGTLQEGKWREAQSCFSFYFYRSRKVHLKNINFPVTDRTKVLSLNSLDKGI